MWYLWLLSMHGIHLEPIRWKYSGGTYIGKQTKFLHMLLPVIVSGQKMLERSHSYRLLSRMKYFSNSLQTNSALKKECWWGKGIQRRGSNRSQTQPLDSPWEVRSYIPSDIRLDVHPCWAFLWCWEDFLVIHTQLSQASRLFWLLKWTVHKMVRSKCQGHEKQRRD